jgi:hypothetical protein
MIKYTVEYQTILYYKVEVVAASAKEAIDQVIPTIGDHEAYEMDSSVIGVWGDGEWVSMVAVK